MSKSVSAASGFSVIIGLIRRHPRKLAIIFVLALLASLTLAPVPYIGKVIIDKIIFKGGAATAAAGGWLGIPTNLWMLTGLVLLGVLLKLLSSMITGWQSYYILQITRNSLQDVRLETALHLAGAKQSFFESMAPSRIASIAVSLVPEAVMKTIGIMGFLRRISS